MKNSLNRNEENTKAQMATYLNMAMNNFLTLIDHIATRVQLDYTPKDKDTVENGNKGNNAQSARKTASNTIDDKHKDQFRCIVDILCDGQDAVAQKKIIGLLESNLPFFKNMVKDCNRGDYTPIAIGDTLDTIYRVLQANRTYSTHGSCFTPNLDQKRFISGRNKDTISLVIPLDKAFREAQNIVKERFSFTEEELAFLTKERMKQVQKRDGKGNLIKDKYGRPQKEFIENEDFFYRLKKTSFIQGKVGKPIYDLSDTGVIFLACLFLEKKYVELFLTNTLFKFVNDKTERKIIFEIFACLRMHRVSERLTCTPSADALGLDILNELQKCPRPLFDVLPAHYQTDFRIAPSSALDDCVQDVLLLRSNDRFPYFAMRYIDTNQVFEKARFQVRLGSYRYKFYDKSCIDDGNTRVRSLQKDLNGFGRLDEIEARRNEVWSNLIRKHDDVVADTADTQPYITDTRAHYVMDMNKVALRLNFEDDKDYYLPPIQSDKSPCLMPDCDMSTHELPALIFLHLLGGNPEKVIHEYVKNMRRLLRDVQSGTLQPSSEEVTKNRYGIDAKYLPVRLRQYLSGEVKNKHYDFEKHASAMVAAMIEQTQQLRKRFEDKLEKMGNTDSNASKKDRQAAKANAKNRGKSSYVDIRPGVLAQYLADDIIALQPFDKAHNGADKLTGLNFQVMQSSLALYDGDISALESIFESAHLLSGQFCHPFLQKVMNYRPTSIENFYCLYLKMKVAFLKNVAASRNYAQYQFLHPDKSKWAAPDAKQYSDLAERYLEHPIELPRGLFDNAIKKAMRKLFQKEYNDCALSHLVSEYFKNKRNDAPQPFYSFERSYRLWNQLCDTRSRAFDKLPEKALTEKERVELARKFDLLLPQYIEKKKRIFGLPVNVEEEKTKMKHLLREYYDNEKEICQYKTQDMLLLMMAERMLVKLPKNHIKEGALLLRNIEPKGGSVLELPIPFELEVVSTNGKKTVIHQDSIKLKNYGDFFTFLYDKRVDTLLGNVNEIRISRDTLERELSRYDTNRPSVFLNIHRFEDKETWGMEAEDLEKRYETDSPLFSKIVKESSVDQKDVLITLRNAFSHDFYPDLEIIGVKELPEIADKMGSKFIGIVENHIKK